jgi:hypothetical protein
MSCRAFLCGAVFLVAIAASSAANAALVEYGTFTGVVGATGSDAAGLFGTFQAGDIVSGTMTVATTGYGTTTQGQNSIEGVASGNPDLVSISFTLDGVTFSDDGSLDVEAYYSSTQTIIIAYQYQGGYAFKIDLDPAYLAANFSTLDQSILSESGNGSLEELNVGPGGITSSTIASSIGFSLTSFSLSDIAPVGVPEPNALWMLLTSLLGMFLLRYKLRS